LEYQITKFIKAYVNVKYNSFFFCGSCSPMRGNQIGQGGSSK